MNLFTLSNGSQCKSTGSFDLNQDTGFEDIPEDTVLNVIADEAAWDEYNGERSIKIRWSVLDGKYANRKIFQKLKVMDSDTSKSDRAKMMLAAIDENCGGELSKIEREIRSIDLSSCLTRRKMKICVGLWEYNGKTGNWVKSVSKAVPGDSVEPKETKSSNDFDDDIPF